MKHLKILLELEQTKYGQEMDKTDQKVADTVQHLVKGLSEEEANYLMAWFAGEMLDSIIELVDGDADDLKEHLGLKETKPVV